MEVRAVSSEEYGELIQVNSHAYNRVQFNLLNKSKVDDVVFLVFSQKGKSLFGLIGGIRGAEFFSPFSAPFGGFSFKSESRNLEFLVESVGCLETFVKSRKLDSIYITLPPQFYLESSVAKQVTSFHLNEYTVKEVDLNHHFNLIDFDGGYKDRIWKNAKKNLKKSLSSNLVFSREDPSVELEKAYELIKQNRESKGYPLRMTFDALLKTTEIICGDVFLVKDGNDYIAAAITYHVTDRIVQVIYWGDLPGYENVRPMNYLSYHVFEYYKNMGKSILDIGPSSENSVPNYGLCDFKESLGCDVSTKISFFKAL